MDYNRPADRVARRRASEKGTAGSAGSVMDIGHIQRLVTAMNMDMSSPADREWEMWDLVPHGGFEAVEEDGTNFVAHN